MAGIHLLPLGAKYECRCNKQSADLQTRAEKWVSASLDDAPASPPGSAVLTFALLDVLGDLCPAEVDLDVIRVDTLCNKLAQLVGPYETAPSFSAGPLQWQMALPLSS